MLTTLVAALLSLESLGSLPSTSLAVPYLPQTDALCGGAAAAMVFRYWGDVHADIEQFAPLVDKRAGGIADNVLVEAIEARGWRAVRVVGSIDQLIDQIQRGRPVVILVAQRAALNHYLVVTGIEPDAVLVHDPTWGPTRRLAFSDLIKVWEPTNFWSLVILPGDARPPGDRDTASDNWEVSGPLSELAGVRFEEGRYREAEDLARKAVERDPTDRYAWELLAASRFMQDDLGGALRAWNRIGKPFVNLVTIDGLMRARYQTIAAAIGLEPNMLLTEEAFRLAERRLQSLPDRAAARLTLRPEPDGFVTVRAVVAERSGPPRGAIGWSVAGAQAAIEREARVAIPGSTGQGELWSTSWRWWDGRPKVAVGLAAPHTGKFGGVWRIDGSWEAETYRTGADSAPGVTVGESRAHGALTISDWLAANTRFSVTTGVDSWSAPTGRAIFAGGSLEHRWLDDRWLLSGTATTWIPFPARSGFHEAGLRLAFRSSTSAEGWVYLADGGVDTASRNAPLGLWPGAGDGHGRDPLIRAHPLLDGGIIDLDRAVFGRTLVYSHGEAQRWIASATPIRFGIAAFADFARASSRRAAAGSVPQTDVGSGLRVRIPGAAGTLRVDIAHGLRDGADALTFGWQF